jgi:hypothetical protein
MGNVVKRWSVMRGGGSGQIGKLREHRRCKINVQDIRFKELVGCIFPDRFLNFQPAAFTIADARTTPSPPSPPPSARPPSASCAVSGPQALSIAALAFKLPSQLTPRQAHLVSAVDAAGNPLDHGLLLHFKGPASYTGEDVIEFHGHGGVLVTQRVLDRLLSLRCACG